MSALVGLSHIDSQQLGIAYSKRTATPENRRRLECLDPVRLDPNEQNRGFPDYASDSSALVKMYLAGQFGQHPDDVNAYAASSFYAVDRYASYKTSWGSFYEQGGVIIADRYTTSNAVHQCSKLPQEQWEEYLHWLFDYEFRLLGLPAPDRVIYLQVDPAVSQRLMTQRYHGDESKKDVHEKDTAYLARSRAAAEFCARHLGWDTVHCTSGDAMRSIEDIQQEVQQLARKTLG